MQGYVALPGFGITLIRNQMRAINPVIGNKYHNQHDLKFSATRFPVLGQTLNTFWNSIEIPLFIL